MNVNPLEPLWLEQALKGDSQAFTCLVEAYQNPVYNLCYRMLGDSYEAEDAAQETFLRAYRNLKRYDPQRAFATWLLSIAAHYCIDQIRKRRLVILSMDDLPSLDPADPGLGPEASLRQSEEQQRVRVLLNTLGPQDRAALILRYWYEFSYEEIAESLSLSVSAVKSRLHRARNDLAQIWTEQESQSYGMERTHNGRAKSPVF